MWPVFRSILTQFRTTHPLDEKDDLRENAGPFAAPFMLGFPSRAAIRLLRQIRPKSRHNIPCRRLLCKISCLEARDHDRFKMNRS
jgi:hypothetical protein